MSSTTINAWIAQEKVAFENFNEFIALRLEDGIFRSLAEAMRNQLQKKKSAEITLPWGTYSAEVKGSAEGGNITPTFEPSKAFLKMLNKDDKDHDLRQDSFDPEYVQLLKDYVAHGFFYPDSKDHEGQPDKEKGLRMGDDEVDYFLNGYAQVLVTIARDKNRSGKTYRLEIDEAFPHGSFDFEYTDDDVSVKFVPHKVFKQYLKDDSIADKARDADFAAG